MLQPRLEVHVVPETPDVLTSDGSPHRSLQQLPEPAAVAQAASTVPALVQAAAAKNKTWPPGCPPMVRVNGGGRRASIEVLPNLNCNRHANLLPFRRGLVERLRRQNESATWCAVAIQPNYKPGRGEAWWCAGP